MVRGETQIVAPAARPQDLFDFCQITKMKYLLFLLLISPACADEWTDADTGREAVFLGLRTFTYLQTYTAAKGGWKHNYEQNKILGKYPHQDRVTAYFLVHSLVHFGVSRILPADWREGFQYITIGEVGDSALSNHATGVRVNFPFS